MKSLKSPNPFKSVIQTKERIVKAPGRELKVEIKQGEDSVFTIQLPIN